MPLISGQSGNLIFWIILPYGLMTEIKPYEEFDTKSNLAAYKYSF